MPDSLVIIPARIGSKGIPNKNFRLLNGRSPLDRAVDCAILAGFANIVVTTDHSGVANASFGLLATSPLHTDTCSLVDVVLDVLQRIPGSYKQKVLLVQPTQPLRQTWHLRWAIKFLDNGPSAASVVEVEPAAKLYYEGFEPVLGQDVEQRQQARRTFACDGTVYGFRRAWFLEYKTFRSAKTLMMPIPRDQTCRLDVLDDWYRAEKLVPAYSSNSVV